MSKYLKSIVAAVLVSLWATAQAQCIPQNAPGPPRYWDGSRGCYVMQGTPAVNSGMVYAPQPMYVQPQYYGGVQRPVYVQPQYYGGMPQQYYGAPQGGLSTGAVVGGILGGTIGSLAKHHTGQAVIGGTILGGIIGNLFSSSGGQRVITQPAPVYNQPQEIYGGPTIPAEQQVGGTVTVTRQVVRRVSNCSIDGHPELQNLQALTEEQCVAVAKLAVARGTVGNDVTVGAAQGVAPSLPPVVQATGNARPRACTINTGEKSYYFNAVNGVKFGKEQCERYLAKLDPLPDEASMSILP